MAVIKREWKTYGTLYAIDSFRSYWQENERLISQEADRLEVINAPKWNPQTEEEYGEFNSEKELASYFHNEVMLPAFRYSCVVMLYVILERELTRLVENLEKESGSQKLQHRDIRGDLIEQIQKFSEAFFGLRLAECPNYKSLHDLQKIRNCIVHCHGEVNSSKDSAYLIKLRKSRSRVGFFALAGSRLFIDETCIEQFIKEIRGFFEGVFNQLKWKIDDAVKKAKRKLQD